MHILAYDSAEAHRRGLYDPYCVGCVHRAAGEYPDLKVCAHASAAWRLPHDGPGDPPRRIMCCVKNPEGECVHYAVFDYAMSMMKSPSDFSAMFRRRRSAFRMIDRLRAWWRS